MTGLPAYTLDDFTASFQAHMPTGPVWPREPDTTQRAAVAALMPTYVRSWSTACDLVIDSFPASAVFLLPEWEASLGLPDPCAGEDATVAQRQLHVVARLTQSDGPSVASLTAFCAALGYAVTIKEFAPARADVLVADGPVYDPVWAFAWQVSTSSVTEFYFSADISSADDPLETFSNDVLECELARLAPAHTVLFFLYTGAAAIGT